MKLTSKQFLLYGVEVFLLTLFLNFCNYINEESITFLINLVVSLVIVVFFNAMSDLIDFLKSKKNKK